jgi:hypothetical protein
MTMNGKTSLRFVGCVLAVALLSALPAAAQSTGDDAVTVEPMAVVVNVTKGYSVAGASFAVTANVAGLTEITYYVDKELELPEASRPGARQPKLELTQFTFAPASLPNPPVGKRQTVALSVANLTEAGVWTGTLTIKWQGVVTDHLTLPLTVTQLTVPTLQVEAPAQVVVRGERGQKSISHSVTLRETAGGSPVTGLSLYPSGFYNDDLSAVFPLSAITYTLPSQIAGNRRGTAVLTFTLAAASGSYAGNLMVQSDNAVAVPIPVKVEIKEPPQWPFGWLAAGVLLGLLITWYRTSVLPKDQVRARIQTLREHQLEDAAFGIYCGAALVNRQISLAEESLRQGKTAEAGTALDKAETLWIYWKNFSAVVLVHIQNLEKLQAQIKAGGAEFAKLGWVQALQAAIQQTLDEKIPEYVDKAETLETLIDDRTGWAAVLAQGQADHANLLATRANLEQFNQSAEGPVMDAAVLAEQRAKLAEIEKGFGALDKVPTVAELKATEAQIISLDAKLREAGAQAQQQRQTAQACLQGARTKLELLAAGTAQMPVKATAMFLLEGGGLFKAALGHLGAYRYPAADQIARNLYRAAQGCTYLHLATERRKGELAGKWAAAYQAEIDLAGWLTNDRPYLEKAAGDFAPLIEAEVGKLKKAVEAAEGLLFGVTWEDMPPGGAENLEERVWDRGPGLRELVAAQAVRLAKAVEAAGKKAPWLRRLMVTLGSPRARLWAVDIGSFLLFGLLLAFVGFKQLYIDVNTFGVNGGWDYLKLFLWGLGAETTRASIIDLGKNLGYSTLIQA